MWAAGSGEPQAERSLCVIRHHRQLPGGEQIPIRSRTAVAQVVWPAKPAGTHDVGALRAPAHHVSRPRCASRAQCRRTIGQGGVFSSRRRHGYQCTNDRSGPQCGEVSGGSVAATLLQQCPAASRPGRSGRPSADRKRPRSTSRVVQRVAGVSGGQGLLSRSAGECGAIRNLLRMCHRTAIPHRRTAEAGATMRADPGPCRWRGRGWAGRCPRGRRIRSTGHGA